MRGLALFVALGALTVSTFADNPYPTTLKQATVTVLYGGIEQPCDPLPNSSDDEGGGSAQTYCQATLNSFGTMGSISHVGSLDLADTTFGLLVSGCPPVATSWGMFTYGLVQTNIPFANGYLCISPFFPGLYKMPTQPLGSGTVVLTMSSHPAEFAPFTPGSSWNYQFWYRDPAAGGANFNLSNGLHVTFAP